MKCMNAKNIIVEISVTIKNSETWTVIWRLVNLRFVPVTILIWIWCAFGMNCCICENSSCINMNHHLLTLACVSNQSLPIFSFIVPCFLFFFLHRNNLHLLNLSIMPLYLGLSNSFAHFHLLSAFFVFTKLENKMKPSNFIYS